MILSNENEKVLLYTGVAISGLYLQWSIIKNAVNFLKGNKYRKLKKLKAKYSVNIILEVWKEYKRRLAIFYSSVFENGKRKKEELSLSRMQSNINFEYNFLNLVIQSPQYSTLLNNIDNEILKKYNITSKKDFNDILNYYIKNNIEIEEFINYFNIILLDSLQGNDFRNEISIPEDFTNLDILELYKRTQSNLLKDLVNYFIILKKNNKIQFNNNNSLVLNVEMDSMIKELENKNSTHNNLKQMFDESKYEFSLDFYYGLVLKSKYKNQEFFKEYTFLKEQTSKFIKQLFDIYSDYEELKLSLNTLFLPEVIVEDINENKDDEEEAVEVEKDDNKDENEEIVKEKSVNEEVEIIKEKVEEIKEEVEVIKKEIQIVEEKVEIHEEEIQIVEEKVEIHEEEIQVLEENNEEEIQQQEENNEEEIDNKEEEIDNKEEENQSEN